MCSFCVDWFIKTGNAINKFGGFERNWDLASQHCFIPAIPFQKYDDFLARDYLTKNIMADTYFHVERSVYTLWYCKSVIYCMFVCKIKLLTWLKPVTCGSTKCTKTKENSEQSLINPQRGKKHRRKGKTQPLTLTRQDKELNQTWYTVYIYTIPNEELMS